MSLDNINKNIISVKEQNIKIKKNISDIQKSSEKTKEISSRDFKKKEEVFSNLNTFKEKLPILLRNKAKQLVIILIPKIIEIVIEKSKIDPDLIMKVMSMDKESAKQGGIDEILKQAGKIGVCIPTIQLNKIINIRNSMMDSLNVSAIFVDTLSKTLDPLKTTSDTTTKIIDATNIAIPIALVAISLLPTPTPPIPPPAIAAGQQIQTVEKTIVTLALILNGIINQINSTQSAIDSVNPIFTKIINLFKIIDKYLLGCDVNDINATKLAPLTPLNSSLQALDNAQKQQVLDAQNVNAVDFPSSVYKGFTLDIVKEPFSPTVDRVKAVAKNPQGIVLLQTPLSFTTTPQVLVSEIKLIIDSNPNLKAE